MGHRPVPFFKMNNRPPTPTRLHLRTVKLSCLYLFLFLICTISYFTLTSGVKAADNIMGSHKGSPYKAVSAKNIEAERLSTSATCTPATNDLGGTVWRDLNGNGVRDEYEPLLDMATYSHIDDDLKPGSYTYWLVTVDRNDGEMIYGPMAVRYGHFLYLPSVKREA